MNLDRFFDEPKTADKLMNDVVTDNVNMSVPWYLMACYAYYIEDDPILSDSEYDKLAKKMVDMWDEISHYHKDLLSLDAVKAGTALLKKEDYPQRVLGGLEHVRRQINADD